MALFEELGDALGGDTLDAWSGFLGADNDDQAAGLLGKAGPALLGALGKRSRSDEGAEAIFGAVQGADDGILDNISGFLGGGDAGGLGGQLVGGLLGGKRKAVESGLAQQSGVGGAMVAKLLPMLAPMVMSFIKRKLSGGGSASGLASMLSDNTNAMRSDGLGSVLDLLDGDDDPSDEAGFLDSFTSMAGLGGATAAAGAVAGKLTGGVGDAAGKVTGGVRDGTDRARSMADIDAPRGGGLLKWLLPLLVIAAAVALVLWACSGSDSDGDDGDGSIASPAEITDLGGRTVTVGVENAYLPFNYIPIGESEGAGWDYDAWNEICRILNCVPEFVPAGWPDVIDQVAQGEIDTAADGISITDERKEIVAFSDPYMTVQQKFIVGLDDDRYSSADDIVSGDAIVATQVGTTNFELAEELLGGTSRIQAFDQFGLAIQALIAGDVDAVIIDDAAGLGYIGENADQVKTIDDGLQSDPLGFIYPLDSELVGPVNGALNEMKSSGFLDQIGAKFFGTEFTITYDDIEG